VKAEDKGGAEQAMHAVERGFVIGSIISVVGFLLLGVVYLQFDKSYIINQAVDRGLFRNEAFLTALGKPEPQRAAILALNKEVEVLQKALVDVQDLKKRGELRAKIREKQEELDRY